MILLKGNKLKILPDKGVYGEYEYRTLIIEKEDEIPPKRFWGFKRFDYIFIHEDNKYKKEFEEASIQSISILEKMWVNYCEFKDISNEVANNLNLNILYDQNNL